MEASRKKGFLHANNLYSRFNHICGFFEYIGQNSKVSLLNTWLENKKTEDNEKVDSGFEVGNNFKRTFKELKTDFIQRPSKTKLKLLMIASLAYSFPLKIQDILDFSCDTYKGKDFAVYHQYRECPSLVIFIQLSHTYIEGYHPPRPDCKIIKASRKAIYEKFRRNFGECTTSKLTQNKKSKNWYLGKAVRVLKLSDIISKLKETVSLDRVRSNS